MNDVILERMFYFVFDVLLLSMVYLQYNWRVDDDWWQKKSICTMRHWKYSIKLDHLYNIDHNSW